MALSVLRTLFETFDVTEIEAILYVIGNLNKNDPLDIFKITYNKQQ